MTIFTRVKYFQAVLMYKCMNGQAPEYLSEKFISCKDVYNYSLRSASSGCLHIPRPNSEFLKRTFKYSGLIVWNSIPSHIKDINKIDNFKKKCSDYFLNLQIEEVEA